MEVSVLDLNGDVVCDRLSADLRDNLGKGMRLEYRIRLLDLILTVQT